MLLVSFHHELLRAPRYMRFLFMLLTRRGSRSTFFLFLICYLAIPWIVKHGDVQIAHRSRASIQLLETISGGPVSHCFVDVKFYSHLWANISAGSSESQAKHAAVRSCAMIIITS